MRKWILKVHPWVGLVSAVFVVVMGLSGAIIAFENDYDDWLHPSLWHVTPQPQRISQQTLADMVEQEFAPAKLQAIFLQDTRADLAQVYFLSNDLAVFVNP